MKLIKRGLFALVAAIFASFGLICSTEANQEEIEETAEDFFKGELCERDERMTEGCMACAETGIISSASECCSLQGTFDLCQQAIILSEENNNSNEASDEERSLTEKNEAQMTEDLGVNEMMEEEKRKSPFLGKRRNPFLGKRRNPFLGKRRSPFLGKRRSPFLGKRRSPFLGKRRTPFLGKRRSPFLGKRRSPFLGKRDDLDLPDHFQFGPADNLRNPTKLISDRMLEKREIRTE